MYSKVILCTLLLHSCSCLLLVSCVPLQQQDQSIQSQQVLIRHRRSLERENEPPKESTIVMQSNTTSVHDLPKDFENEIVGGTANDESKNCKDFIEFDYNPINDSLFFNGRMPSFNNQNNMFAHRNMMGSFEEMFNRMMNQASSMFRRFPFDRPSTTDSSTTGGLGLFDLSSNKFPENYNGTTDEIITIGGKQFRKKQTVVNKSVGGSKISIMSTVYEPVEEPNNTKDVPLPSNTDSTKVVVPSVNTIMPEFVESEPAQVSTVRNDLTDGKIVSYK